MSIRDKRLAALEIEQGIGSAGIVNVTIEAWDGVELVPEWDGSPVDRILLVDGPGREKENESIG